MTKFGKNRRKIYKIRKNPQKYLEGFGKSRIFAPSNNERRETRIKFNPLILQSYDNFN